VLFKGDEGITRRLGSGQRSNVYGKDPVRSGLDLTKCLRERADLEIGCGKNGCGMGTSEPTRNTYQYSSRSRRKGVRRSTKQPGIRKAEKR